MNTQFWKTRIGIVLLVASAANGYCQEAKIPWLTQSEALVIRNLPDWTFTTKTYQAEAMRLMLEEANSVAAELPLNEQLPITKSNLIEYHIGPPALISLGWISTSNYAYTIGIGRRFCGLDQRNMTTRFNADKARYEWPISRMDTNRAFQIATQLMATVSIDVAGLNRDCLVQVSFAEPRRGGTNHFFPNYTVIWRKPGQMVAFVEFVEPTKSVRQIHVTDPTYILREPIKIANLAVLLNQTNALKQP